MSDYTFETPEFGLSDEGLHLLRSGYNYKTLAYDDIREATLKRGVAIKNWLLILLVGVALISFAVYQAAHVYHLFTRPGANTIYMESILLPVLPLLLGNYCVYVSLRRATILKVRYRGGRKKLPMKTIINDNQAFALTSFLQEKLGAKFQVEDHDAVSVLATNIS